MEDFQATYRLALEELEIVFGKIAPAQVEALIDAILAAEQVFHIGVGRVMLCLKAFSKRLNHLGVRSHCVGDPNEPGITDKDLLIVGSGSGESVVPLAIARVATKYKPRIAHIGSNYQSSLKPFTDVFVRIPSTTKLNLPGEMLSKQPMTNTFDQTLWVFCDVLTMMIIQKKRLDLESLWRYHANLQ